MILQYCSDLHLEFSKNREYLRRYPIQPKGEVLLLAGDIVPFTQLDAMDEFFDLWSSQFTQVYWLPGNHEYYHWNLPTGDDHIYKQVRHNVHLVNNQCIVHASVRLVFSTLWSNISPVNEAAITRRISDFHQVTVGGTALTIADFNALHEQSKNFLRTTLGTSPDQPTETVVITHHVPTLLNYPSHYIQHVLTEAFVTEQYDFILNVQPAAWIYGHHHSNIPPFRIGETAMLTNQLGYVEYREQKAFRTDATLEI
jgi:predicted phosphohydrolase